MFPLQVVSGNVCEKDSVMDVPIFDKTPKSNVCFILFSIIILSITIYDSNNNIDACFYLFYSLGSHNRQACCFRINTTHKYCQYLFLHHIMLILVITYV
jgi:hypothetical protein